MTLADTYFTAQCKSFLLREDLEREIINILNKNPDDPDTWGFDDITMDYYDHSFELKSCTEQFTVSPEQAAAFRDLGFAQCWFCTQPAGKYDPGTHVAFVENAP